MARLSIKLDSEKSNFLEQEAIKVANEFSCEYRTFRNSLGKEYILVYGGNSVYRKCFVDKISKNLPIGINAFVLENDKKRGIKEIENDPRAFYVNFDTILN